MNSNWSYGLETAKWDHDLCDPDLWPLTLTFCMDIVSVNGNNSWKFQDDTMTGTLSKRCDRRTDRQTEISVLRAAWSQLKRSEGLAIESLTSTRLCLMILFRFCSYLCCLSMGNSYNFRLCFELQNVTPGQNNIAPHIRSWCDEAKI